MVKNGVVWFKEEEGNSKQSNDREGIWSYNSASRNGSTYQVAELSSGNSSTGGWFAKRES